jgi:hypothetical protein
MQDWTNKFKYCLFSFSCLFVYPYVSLFAAAPKVDYLFPAGGQAGTQVTLTATGEFSTWPVKVACDRQDVTITAEKDKGKFVVALAAQASPGIAWLRFYDVEGTSSLRPFMISTLAESEEVEPNEAVGNAQAIKRNLVVNGRLSKTNDVDGFLIELAAGEKFTATVQAHSLLGSPLDAMLQVCELVPRLASSATEPAKLEAFVVEQNHDSLGLDPAIHFTAPREGKYLLRLFAIPAEPDSSINFSGKESYVYRLTVTDAEIDATKLLPPPRDEFPVIKEPNQRDQPLTLPMTIASEFSLPPVAHTYSFTAQQGKKIAFLSATRSLGYRTELALKVRNAQGAVLVEAERTEPNKEIEFSFNPPLEGIYTLQVEEVNQRGGTRFAYRITAVAPEQTFELTTPSDSFVVLAGKTLEIPLTIDRRHGFTDRIEIRTTGLPAGVTAEPVFSESKGDSSKSVKLILKATADAPANSAPFTIFGTANAITRPVMFSTTLPLDQKHTEFWLTTVK